MPKSNWASTQIFRQLTKRKGVYADKIKELLKNPGIMDTAECILDKGASTPKDFTLHDGDHSFRVAERIWDLIPDITKKALSDYELGLLLLCAYVHDIGMSPDFKKVELHRAFLTTDKKDLLTEVEISEFQKWVDNDDKLKAIDIRKEKVDDTKISNYILSYYIRYKHNDWSGEWIKENLEKHTLENYHSWSDDLIKICKSHHYGIDNLKSEAFDPKPIGEKSRVHLRYLAMCLRVADVMENDPERTPEVILKHRLIDSDSLVFWLKDRRFNLTRDGNRFAIYARPEKAFLHKAIEETAHLIENELKLCDELIKIKPLKQSSFGELNKYEWNIEAVIHKDIVPKEDTYVYIQGAFRPNTAKILELLGGNQLYGDSIWAYRELIQNSFDAVKEKMAYQVINENKDPKEFLPKLGDFYSIDIVLEKRADGVWLICKDQGIGMTKSIIEKYFLESGSSKRHEISELERKCREKGFNSGRTGQFGIGVLSYFMIAEKIIVRTKRELNTGYPDSESMAWRFEINGTHDFGELSKYNKPINGTEIELKLKTDVEKNISEWNKRFYSFLKKTVSKSPCNLTYISKIENEQKQVKSGWTNTTQDIKAKLLGEVGKLLERDKNKNIEDKIISSSEKEKLLKNKLLVEESILEMEKIVDFLFDDGEIEGLGQYRIYIPYFKLAKGNSYCYLKEEINSNTHLIVKVNGGHFWLPKFGEINFSLKGIRIDVTGIPIETRMDYTMPAIPGAHVEIDIETIKESGLSVSRHNLLLKETFSGYKDIVDAKVYDLIARHKDSFNNCYRLLNYEYVKFDAEGSCWIFENKGAEKIENKLVLKKIGYPLCESNFQMDDYNHHNIQFQGKGLQHIERLFDYAGGLALNWIDKVRALYKAGIINPLEMELCPGGKLLPLLTGALIEYSKDSKWELGQIALPEAWNKIVLLNIGFRYNWHNLFLNINSQYPKSYDVQFLNDMKERGLSVAKNELVNEALCFTFLLYAIMNYQEEKWVGLCEKREELMQHVFDMLQITEIYILEDMLPIQISLAGWNVGLSKEAVAKVLPKITDEQYLLKVNNN